MYCLPGMHSGVREGCVLWKEVEDQGVIGLQTGGLVGRGQLWNVLWYESTMEDLLETNRACRVWVCRIKKQRFTYFSRGWHEGLRETSHRASAGYVLLENLMASCLKSNSSIIKWWGEKCHYCSTGHFAFIYLFLILWKWQWTHTYFMLECSNRGNCTL